MKAYAKFDNVLIVGYFSNRQTILDVEFFKFSATYMDGMIGDPPLYFGFSTVSDNDSSRKTCGFLKVGYFLNNSL